MKKKPSPEAITPTDSCPNCGTYLGQLASRASDMDIQLRSLPDEAAYDELGYSLYGGTGKTYGLDYLYPAGRDVDTTQYGDYPR